MESTPTKDTGGQPTMTEEIRLLQLMVEDTLLVMLEVAADKRPDHRGGFDLSKEEAYGTFLSRLVRVYGLVIVDLVQEWREDPVHRPPSPVRPARTEDRP